MNYYTLFYEVVDDFVARRAPFRQEHLRLANEARERGEVVFAGALAEPADGALIVFHADDKSKAESFARNDPYVQNGLVKKWEVRTWNVVVGNQPLPFSSTPAAGTILRRWSARATAAQLPQYLEYFARNVLPELHRVPGYLGGTVTHRRLESEVEIVVETSWRSLEPILNFAGSDIEAAVVGPEAVSLLKNFDRRVTHSEIAITDRR